VTLPSPARLLCAALLSFGLVGSAVPALANDVLPNPSATTPAPSATTAPAVPSTPPTPSTPPASPAAPVPTNLPVSEPVPTTTAPAQDEVTSFVPDLDWNPLADPDSNARYGEHYAEPAAPLKAASPLSVDDGAGMAAMAPRSGTFRVTLVTVQLAGKTVADTNAINMTAARNSITKSHEYWNAASAGRLSMTKVNEIRHVSKAKITDSYGTIMATVTKELNWQYRAYESLVIFVPHADLNYNGSWGILGGGFTDGPTSGRVIMPYPSALTNNVVTHEFGHVLGLHHANSLACSNGRTDVPRSGASWADPACYSAEYSDTTDLMGYAQVSSPRINAFLWEYGGFGLGNEIRNVGTPSGPSQYILKAWAGAGADRAIKFTDPVSKEVYYLELRLPVGDDTVSAKNGNKGVKITKKDILGWSGNASILLTPNSRNSGWANTSLAWQAGQTFTTHAGTKVRIDSIGTSDARITIEPLQSGAALAGSAIAAAAARTAELGAATSGVVCGLVAGGCYQNFQGGAVTWTAGIGAHATINGAIRNAWQASGFETGRLGYPTSAKVCGLVDGGCYQNFQRGAILWSPTTGAHLSTAGAIRTAYQGSGFEGGSLGYPTSAETCGLRDGGCYQNFQRGAILWSPTTGAQVSPADAIRTAYQATGFEAGNLGYPTGPQICGITANGCYQDFQGGAIHWTSSTGAYATVGDIRRAWATTGYETGSLGYPTGPETCGIRDGGCYQNYQRGAILWSPTTGAQTSPTGPIRTAYQRTGFEAGNLGYPTGPQTCGIKDGGCYQNYQGGAITWSPTAGAHPTVGDIRRTWATTGYETGRLGYPTTNETCTTSRCTQTFQGGTLTWTPTTGTTIRYN
jgi:uncharacterized protein with LGFP repeats